MEKFLIVRNDTLECPVCLETSIDSFCVFPCGHSFCRSCTVTVISQLKATWTGWKFCECPICHHRVAEKESQRPPRNFVIQSLFDSATHITVELSECENMMQREKEQLTGRIAEQRGRIERLEIANVELWERTNTLFWTALLIFILAMLFLATTVYIAKGTQGEVEVLTCKNPVPIVPKTTWQRTLDYLLLLETTDPVDKLIIRVSFTVQLCFYCLMLGRSLIQ